MSSVDQIVEQAYALIDGQSNYTIPKLERWKKTHKVPGGKVVSACVVCGNPVAHAPEKHPLRCAACRKNVSDLYKKRKIKNFCKNSVILL